ncbi:MAG: SOS response-associated peptidase [Tistlia sp.]
MCGRYTLTSPLEALKELFGFLERPNLEPRANIAPTQEVLVVRLGEDGERHAASLRWGLLPPWAVDGRVGARLINARAEGVTRQPAFRKAFAARRCLVAADGFYEWQAQEGGKQPYRICRQDGGPFAFAGLWERWHDPAAPKEAPVESCTILTTEANALLRPIHQRMPVILPAEAHGAWLAPDSAAEDLQALLRPLEPEGWIAYPVSRRVNKVANDDLALLAPAEPMQQRSLL